MGVVGSRLAALRDGGGWRQRLPGGSALAVPQRPGPSAPAPSGSSHGQPCPIGG